jgi:pimeloyl-ACP methyl ester carboxylesterase
VDATLGLTRLVASMHHNIARVPLPLGQFSQEPPRGITGLVYRSIQGCTRLVGDGIDALLGQLLPLIDGAPTESSALREAVLAALNGVLGDHLAASDNPLAIEMCLRRDGKRLPLERRELAEVLPAATGKILLLAHGLCMNDRQWRRDGYDHGAALAAAGGYTPIYLHYNSGQHVSTNGQALSEVLEDLVKSWPVPIEKLVIVGHSMGGLVARSACHHAEQSGRAWLGHLRQMVFLGTPHLGAPLERGGNWIDVILGISPYTAALARLGKIRSAGITDLRHGSILDEDWQHGDRFARGRAPRLVPLPAGVECHAVGVALAKAPGHVAEPLLGDGLVPLKSALGEGTVKRGRLDFPESPALDRLRHEPHGPARQPLRGGAVAALALLSRGRAQGKIRPAAM